MELGVTNGQVSNIDKGLAALNIISKVYKECSDNSSEKSLLGKLKRGIHDVIVWRLLSHIRIGDRKAFVKNLEHLDLDTKSCVFNAYRKVVLKHELDRCFPPTRAYKKARAKKAKLNSKETSIIENDWLECYKQHHDGTQAPDWQFPEWLPNSYMRVINGEHLRHLSEVGALVRSQLQ